MESSHNVHACKVPCWVATAAQPWLILQEMGVAGWVWPVSRVTGPSSEVKVQTYTAPLE